MKRLTLFPLLLALGGCAHEKGGSLANGECKVFERPPYVVKGQTQYDQDVADNYVESGVGGCKWARPAPRPAALDAVPLPKPRPVAPKKKKPLWLQMLHQWPTKAAPVVIVPEREAAPNPPPPPPPPPVKRSAIDELLHPDGAK